MGKSIDLYEWWGEIIAGIALVFTLIVTIVQSNPLAGYASVGIIAFYFGGIYTLYRSKDPTWPAIVICFGALIGVLVGARFGRRLLVLAWYILVTLVSIHAFKQNWVKRFKRRNWIK